MKILILGWRDVKNPAMGGSEIYFHEMAKRWIDKGHKVSMICSGFNGCKKREIVDGIEIHRNGGEMSQFILTPLTYLRLQEKPDIIIDVENGIPFFSPLFSGKPKILHIHHLHKQVWFKEKPFYLASLGLFLESIVMPIIYRNIGITTISRSSSEEIIRELNLENMKPNIISPGIDFVKFKKVKKSKSPTILFLNRIKKYKGIKTFLDAAEIFEKEKLNGKFLVVGSGEKLEEMRKYARERKNVKFWGRVSEKEKEELMQSSWVFVNPSFKEGWGIVNIEANYFGTPIIGSDVEGIRDSVIDGKTGLLFKYEDAKDLVDKIKQIINDKALREKLSHEGQIWAKQFSWEDAAEKFLKVLEEKMTSSAH